MTQDPYDRFAAEELILRDELAIDRTVLANERTLLAYSRTALTFIIAGLTFVHFLDEGWLLWVGALFIPLGLLTGALGYWRFRKVKQSIERIRQRLG